MQIMGWPIGFGFWMAFLFSIRPASCSASASQPVLPFGVSARKIRAFGISSVPAGDPDQQTSESLKIFNSGYGVEYQGKGEVLRVKDIQRTGYREIFFDQQKKIILSEKIVTYPSSFRIERLGGSDTKKIALSFDDGPDKTYTPQILDVLNKFGVKASFFIIGLNATADPDTLRKIYNDGHEIGIHTFTHPELSSVSPDNSDWR